MKTALAAVFCLALVAPQDKERIREGLKDTELKGAWVYDDIDAGLAEAKKTGKPMMVVLRCVPCVTFKGFDKQVASRENPELSALMDRFVCVRVVQGYGLDLSFFQFDYDLNWAVVLMNADRTIYGRYGSKTGEKGNAARVTIEGLCKALEAALEFHQGYPGNAKDFAAKVGPPARWKTPEAIPDMKNRPNAVPADGTRQKCVHCHMIREAELWTLRSAGEPIPETLLWAYPMPDAVGLSMDLKERATVKDVAAGSAAEKGGFRAGDSIRRLHGQPILSVADVQWVLHTAQAPVRIDAEIDRNGAPAKASLDLAGGWRRGEDFSWRVQIWAMRHKLLGMQPLDPLSADDRQKLGAPAVGLALRIKGFPPDFVKDKNREAAQKFQKDDVIVDVDGQKDLPGESGVIAYVFQKKPGDTVEFGVIRGGKAQKVTLTLP
ncbi:MAG TPA: Trx7/PDZ domain-containing (seleno)protein [Planctomycetota bacterium]|nr:Trx7/PDZ domain-containing (seleno)protein [Planctomycetota bacterium]